MQILFDLLMVVWMVMPAIGVFYAWSEWHAKIYRSSLPRSHRFATNLGLFFLTLQALLFLALWTPISRYDLFLKCALVTEFISPILALPCVLLWRSRARWWVLASSVCLLMDSFLIVAAQLD